jgi:hypothetical protein
LVAISQECRSVPALLRLVRTVVIVLVLAVFVVAVGKWQGPRAVSAKADDRPFAEGALHPEVDPTGDLELGQTAPGLDHREGLKGAPGPDNRRADMEAEAAEQRSQVIHGLPGVDGADLAVLIRSRRSCECVPLVR